jgi:hypothetical protein
MKKPKLPFADRFVSAIQPVFWTLKFRSIFNMQAMMASEAPMSSAYFRKFTAKYYYI